MLSKKYDLNKLYNSVKRPLILDGALGSLLQQKGFMRDTNLWFSKYNLENPQVVHSLHNEYVSAGADIITTNTFRTNPASLKASGYEIDISSFVKKSIQLAINARAEKYLIIAGSNAPAEDCYQKERNISFSELDYNHKKHIELLWENGADIIWNETQSHWDEINIICNYCNDSSIRYAINFYFDDNLLLLSGEPLHEAVSFVRQFNPQVVGFNCIKPSTFLKYLEKFPLPQNWGFYFNCGSGNVTDEILSCGISPADYLIPVKQALEYLPMFVGSCCGSSPLHTKVIKEYFDEIY